MNRLGTFFFGLIFASVGFGFIFFQTIPSLVEQHEMQRWQPVEATVTSANLQTHTDEDSTTYQVTGSFRYYWDDVAHTSNRISIHSGSDNIGSYHQDRYRELRKARDSNTRVLIYVNPQAPHEAIYDRNVRWGLLMFGLLFVFAFGGLGVGVMIYAIFGKNKSSVKKAATSSRPWLQNKDWQGGAIFSTAKSSMYMLVFGSLVWNGFSWPMAFIVYSQTGWTFPAMLASIFPVVGLLILYSTWKSVANWFRYGRTPLVLDPYPGSIGGNIGGYIEINQTWKPGRHYKVTVACIYSYMSGSGDDRSRSERLEWQEKGYAESNSYNNKTRVKFRFDIPEKLPTSDATPGENYHLWRLNIECSDKGAEIERSYTIPVYETAQMSQIPYPLSKDHPGLKEDTLNDIENFLRVERVGSALSIHMPTGKRIKAAVIIFIVSTLSTAGLSVLYQDTKAIILLLFLVIGGLAAIFSLFAIGKSRTLTINQQGFQTRTWFFGVPLKSESLARSEFSGFEKRVYMKSSSGHNHYESYELRAKGRGKRKLVIVDRLKGRHEVDQLLESIKTLTGYQ